MRKTCKPASKLPAKCECISATCEMRCACICSRREHNKVITTATTKKPLTRRMEGGCACDYAEPIKPDVIMHSRTHARTHARRRLSMLRHMRYVGGLAFVCVTCHTVSIRAASRRPSPPSSTAATASAATRPSRWRRWLMANCLAELCPPGDANASVLRCMSAATIDDDDDDGGLGFCCARN